MNNTTELVLAQQDFFNKASSSDVVLWQKESQFAIQSLAANDYLSRIALTNPVSLQNAIINIASIGISLNPALKHAYLVPRKGNVCLDISYMGLLHIAQSDGAILWGQSKLVYTNDKYENIGIDKAPIHKANSFGDRGNVVGCYCTVKLPNGDFLTEEMSIDDIHNIRNRSETYKKNSGPWVSDAGEMTRKTVVKRAYKYWPKCDQLSKAIDVINEHEGIVFEKEVYEAPVNDEQKETYHRLISEGKDFEFYEFCLSLTEDEENALYNSFEKGEKVKNKDKADLLKRTAINTIIEMAEETNQAAQNCDDQAINEAIEDVVNYKNIKTMFFNKLSNETQGYIKQLKKAA